MAGAAYITATQMRAASLAEFAWGLAVDQVRVPDDGHITSTIARVSQDFDDWTNDRFSSDAAVALTLTGSRDRRLELPRRTTAITTLSITNSLGTVTNQASTVYRLHSSLEPAGDRRRPADDIDYVEMIPFQYLTGATYGPTYVWPSEPNSITVTGTYGWTVTPPKVKRAIALLVYDFYNPQADVLRQVIQLNDAGTSYSFQRDAEHPSGIPEVDQTVRDYTYRSNTVLL